jgi:hypothetical protein
MIRAGSADPLGGGGPSAVVKSVFGPDVQLTRDSKIHRTRHEQPYLNLQSVYATDIGRCRLSLSFVLPRLEGPMKAVPLPREQRYMISW